MSTQAVYYRAHDGSEPVADFLDKEFPVEPRKKNPSDRELQAAATKRVTIDLQIDRLNGLCGLRGRASIRLLKSFQRPLAISISARGTAALVLRIM
jgi:hypothetical protein